MNANSWWIPIITVAIGAIFGGLAGLLSPIAQARLEKRRRLDEIYRTNIGNQIYTLYFPLLEILNQLEKALDNLNNQAEYMGGIDHEDETGFREECMELIVQISKLLNQGKEIYLTTELAKRLKTFEKFMRDSMELEENMYHPKYYTAEILIRKPFSTKKLIVHTESKGDREKIWEIQKHARKKEIDNIICAPFLSSLFDLRYNHDIHEMKALIRNVVLNSPHSPSPPQI